MMRGCLTLCMKSAKYQEHFSPKVVGSVSYSRLIHSDSKKGSPTVVEQVESKNASKPVERDFDALSRRDYRFIFPEFLPDPNPSFRNSVAERLQRQDMIARREVVEIPEFYVGTIMAV